jgi:hypothetical protein
LKTLGVDVPALIKSSQNLKFYDDLALQAGAFFDQEEIAQIETAKIDYMPGVSSDEKKQRLSRMSYEAFLRDVIRVDPARSWPVTMC